MDFSIRAIQIRGLSLTDYGIKFGKKNRQKKVL
jgi:hypothetical protein